MNFNNLNIDFSKNFNKKERAFFKSLDIKEKTISISLEKFMKEYNFTSREKIPKFFLSLLKKYIILYSEAESYFSYISIIQSFQISDKVINLTLSDEIFSSFKKGTNFEKLGINKIITFEEKFSYRLFHYLNQKDKKTTFISIDELRELLEIKETYTRFYDIEKNILIPIVKDLNKNGDLEIVYYKNKCGDYKTAKILGITFENKNLDLNNNVINELMQLVSGRINDFSEIYNLILNNLAKYGEEYVRKNIDLAINSNIGDLDTYLKKLFNRNLTDEKPYLTIKKRFKSLFELHMEVLKIAEKESAYPSNLKFLIKIYSLKDGDTIICDGKDIYLKITYSKNDISTIEIFYQNI